MSIDNLTIGAAKELVKMFGASSQPAPANPHIGKFIILRTRDSGVHCGVLVSQAGQVVELHNSRRIWRWRGANTLNELSVNGASMTDYTRISDPVESIIILDGLECIPCTEKARANLEVSRWN